MGVQEEFEIARVVVGKTRASELNGIFAPPQFRGAIGHPVREASGHVTHYYTTEERSAVVAVTCDPKGVAQSVRLKLGFWGPLAGLDSLPPQSVSDCALEVLGTYHGVHVGRGRPLFHGRERALKIYGEPTHGTASELRYDWFHGPTPRRLTLGLQGEVIAEMVLELVDPSLAQGIRTLAPPEPFERQVPLPPELQARLAAGEHEEVLALLNEGDLDPTFLKAEIGVLSAVARQDVERLQGLLDYQVTYASYNPPEVLRTRFALGHTCRTAGQPERARIVLSKLWDDMQVSNYYAQPEVQHLVRRTAAELELLGVPRYAEEVRRQDAARL